MLPTCRICAQNRKIWARSGISREMRSQISLEVVRRRRRSRRTRARTTIRPPKVIRQAGQHRLPGGQDAKCPGVLGLGCISDLRFESRVTLHMGMHILGGEQHGGKKSRRISPRRMNFAESDLARGARVGAGRLLGAFRGKFRFFASFSANCEKPPPPRLEPATSPTFA